MIDSEAIFQDRRLDMAEIVIIGGSDAGISAAFRAREVEPSTG
jgi:hypothetical protein